MGNLVALGTKLPLDGGGGHGDSLGEGGAAAQAQREQREFVRVVTYLLELPAIPDSLLTDRQAITWKTTGQDGDRGGGGGTLMTALALPQAVQDQVCVLLCRLFFHVATTQR